MGELHICRGIKKECYNPFESYGEICVGCGCCDTDPEKRALARLALHQRLLKEDEEFDRWWDDDPEWLAVQKRNIANNIEWNKAKIAEYEEEIKKIRG